MTGKVDFVRFLLRYVGLIISFAILFLGVFGSGLTGVSRAGTTRSPAPWSSGPPDRLQAPH